VSTDKDPRIEHLQDDNPKSFGEQLRRIRIRQGLTQLQLQMRLENLLGYTIGDTTISSWENDRRLPGMDAINALVIALHLQDKERKALSRLWLIAKLREDLIAYVRGEKTLSDQDQPVSYEDLTNAVIDIMAGEQ
jgi:transcriptional regulator with XRE-family HTH domain